MDNLKTGDRVQIKETGEEATIGFASTTLENNFYLLTVGGITIRDEYGSIKEFYIEDLTYTNDQKEWMQYEANLHAQEMQAIHPPLEYL